MDLRWPDNSVSRLAFPAEFQFHGVDPLPPEVLATDSVAAAQSQALNNWATRPTLFRHRNRRRHEETPTPVVSTQKQPVIPSVQEHPTQPVISELLTVPQVAQAESSGALQQEGGTEPNQQHYEADPEADPQPMIIASGSTQGDPPQHQPIEIAPSAKKRKSFLVSEAALAREEAELDTEAAN
ncbi:hypothetical protein R1sor_017470 [Riccia sorocarpa]|uniref:Uncharacterized protein n=1 Tax=Riccia sorocarpa TaxID=122646 RepID=A0ABD3I6Y8_9MARC